MNNNFVKKNKFISNNCLDYNKQPYYSIESNTNAQFDEIKSNYNNREKTQMVLASTLNPYDYDLDVKNNIKEKEKQENSYMYFTPYDQGPGRGFGNASINNSIRLGENGRNDTQQFKSFRESEIVDRFQFVDSRFNNPTNLVFPFPRSGENTRKVNSFSNAGDFINNYQSTTPNLIKKEIFGNFEQAMNFNYDIPQPNNVIINNIKNNNEIERRNQRDYIKQRENYNNKYKLEADQYKNDFEKQMAQQKAQQNGQ
jgi:hypothetical protein